MIRSLAEATAQTPARLRSISAKNSAVSVPVSDALVAVESLLVVRLSSTSSRPTPVTISLM